MGKKPMSECSSSASVSVSAAADDGLFGFSVVSVGNAARTVARRQAGLRGGGSRRPPTRTRCPEKEGRLILRQLMLADSREFAAVKDRVTSRTQIICADGKVLLQNSATKARDCVSVYDLKKKFFSLMPASNARWLDQDVWWGTVTTSTTTTRNNQHVPVLVVLDSLNSLKVFDLTRGTQLASVSLGSPSNGPKFKRLSCNMEQGTIVVKSVRTRGDYYSHRDSSPSDVVVSLAVFTFPPLEFSASFDVRRSCFGDRACDASVHHDILVVEYAGGLIRFFSLEHILERFATAAYRLGDAYSAGIVGVSGVPVNVDITQQQPPVLFEVKSQSHYLQIGAYPWKYLISPSPGEFTLHDLGNLASVKNGRFGVEDPSDQELIFFHMDDSGRILHSVMETCSVYQISGGVMSKLASLSPDFGKDGGGETGARARLSGEVITSSGRRSRRRVSHAAPDSEIRRDVTIDYEDELDVLAVLGTVESPSDCGCDVGEVHTRLDAVTLYDNRTCSRLRRVPLGDVLAEPTDILNVRVALDRDVLTVTAKASGKSNLFIYRLREKMEEEEKEEAAQNSAGNSAPRRCRRTRQQVGNHASEAPP